jgi:hypothetical protein
VLAQRLLGRNTGTSGTAATAPGAKRDEDPPMRCPPDQLNAYVKHLHAQKKTTATIQTYIAAVATTLRCRVPKLRWRLGRISRTPEHLAGCPNVWVHFPRPCAKGTPQSGLDLWGARLSASTRSARNALDSVRRRGPGCEDDQGLTLQEPRRASTKALVDPGSILPQPYVKLLGRLVLDRMRE